MRCSITSLNVHLMTYIRTEEENRMRQSKGIDWYNVLRIKGNEVGIQIQF